MSHYPNPVCGALADQGCSLPQVRLLVMEGQSPSAPLYVCTLTPTHRHNLPLLPWPSRELSAFFMGYLLKMAEPVWSQVGQDLMKVKDLQVLINGRPPPSMTLVVRSGRKERGIALQLSVSLLGDLLSQAGSWLHAGQNINSSYQP
jgi:hypothetical protein